MLFFGRHQYFFNLNMQTFSFLSEVVDGQWSMWKYTTMVKGCSCEGGTRSRTRTCSNPIPQNGGKPCSGVEEEEIDCNKEAKCSKL